MASFHNELRMANPRSCDLPAQFSRCDEPRVRRVLLRTWRFPFATNPSLNLAAGALSLASMSQERRFSTFSQLCPSGPTPFLPKPVDRTVSTPVYSRTNTSPSFLPYANPSSNQDHSKHTGAQRYSVRQHLAESQLAHHLHTHEPLGQERSARPSILRKGIIRGSSGQHLRQGASRRHGCGHGSQEVPRWMDDQASYGCRGGRSILPLSRPGPGPEGACSIGWGHNGGIHGSRIFGRRNTPIGVRHVLVVPPLKSRPLGVWSRGGMKWSVYSVD